MSGATTTRPRAEAPITTRRVTAPWVVFVLARVVSVLCVITLAVVAAFDTQAARFTEGQQPAEFAARLDGRLNGDYEDVTGVAHNAGDDLHAATRAVAYGADAIEIDVRAVEGKLYASHDAPVPLLEDLVFHGPSLQDAWTVAQLDEGVLLHLKQASGRYLDELQSFCASAARCDGRSCRPRTTPRCALSTGPRRPFSDCCSSSPRRNSPHCAPTTSCWR